MSRFLYGCALLAVMCVWHAIALHELTARIAVAFAWAVTLSFIYGTVALSQTALARTGRSSLALEFTFGFLLLGIALLVLSLVTSLGSSGNVLAASALGLGGWLVMRLRAPAADRRTTPESACFAALALCSAAATLWCREGLTPIVREGATTIFQLWGDSFVHARHISAFAYAHGYASMSDIRMAGEPLFLYHYASYAIPAAVTAVAGERAYEMFASFLLPAGVMLTGLAAFAFAASIWGRWPAVAASVALLLCPDAFHQGFGNKYLSYNFMQQVNVGGLCGVACVAIAWTFVIHGCRSGSRTSVALGWAVALIALPYKAHVFVANAFVILIYPCVFAAGMSRRTRVMLAVALTGCLLAAVTLSQTVDRMPTLRLDGSSARAYVEYLLVNQDPGFVKSFVEGGLGPAPWSAARLVVFGTLLVALGTFGYWIVAVVATVLWVRPRVPPAVWAFPLVVIANYLVMALGLAMDANAIGAPDELLNRPLVWAYFGVVAWTGGAIYDRLFGDRFPRATAPRALLAAATLTAFAVPIVFGRELQTFPHWPGFRTLREAGAVPSCLVDSAGYIRRHSAPDDVVQDSDNDPRVWVTALAERPEFAMLAPNHPPAGLDARLESLARFRQLTTGDEVKAFAARNGVAWYLLRPTTDVSWRTALRDEAVFECGGFLVYRFAANSASGRASNLSAADRAGSADAPSPPATRDR